MSIKKDEHEKQYNEEKDEGIKKLLQSSLVYSLKIHDFNEEDYYIEDVTAVMADYQALILKIIDEMVDGSFAVMKELGDKYLKEGR